MLQGMALSGVGLRRPLNQDRTAAFCLGDAGLFLVADGMGGHFAGERASQAVLCACEEWWDRYRAAWPRPGFAAGLEQLRALVQRCNDDVRRATPAGRVCGTTAVLLWVAEGCYALLWVGDSRAYQAVPGTLRARFAQLTVDEVAGADAAPADRGKLLRAVGIQDACPPAVRSGRLPDKCAFLLCTDGIYKVCAPALLQRQLVRALRGRPLADCAAELERAVLAGGAPDNYSLVLAAVRPAAT